MNRVFLEYKLIECYSYISLEQEINNFITQGWTLWGDLVVKDNNIFYQGMVR